MKDDSHCRGCTDDFYNGRNDIGVQRCWRLAGAKVVLRWKQGWWTNPDVPGALVQVKTFDCHREPGKFAFNENLPSCAVNPRYLKKGKP